VDYVFYVKEVNKGERKRLFHLKFFSNDFLICLGLTLAMFISSLLCGLNFFALLKDLRNNFSKDIEKEKIVSG